MADGEDIKVLRRDGRTFNQLRAMAAEHSLLNRADGSVRYSQSMSNATRTWRNVHTASDQTTVLVAVYGPMETKRRKELLDKANIEVQFRPRSGVPSMLCEAIAFL